MLVEYSCAFRVFLFFSNAIDGFYLKIKPHSKLLECGFILGKKGSK